MLTWSEDMLGVKCPSRCLRPPLLPGWKLIGFVQVRMTSMTTYSPRYSYFPQCTFPPA